MSKKGVIDFNIKWIVIIVILVIIISIIATVVVYKTVVKPKTEQVGDTSSGTLNINVRDDLSESSGKLSINVVGNESS
jgi:uncharacterized protein YpmB